VIAAAVLAAAAVLVGGGIVAGLTPSTDERTAPATVGSGPAETGPRAAVSVLTLPVARYDAVIPGLLPFDGGQDEITTGYTVPRDIPVYGRDRRTAVARIPARDFVGAPTTVVGAGNDGAWTLILTPARVTLPSRSGGRAPAQSAAWARTSDLHDPRPLHDRIVVSVGTQTLRILHDGAVTATFAVGVGTPGTPTPTDTTGYLQQRYLDPRQGETVHPIQLTSLHASAADEPYAGSDGGLIGIHYNSVSSGAVSHGCIRLDADAITAVDDLPLGTTVTILP
jgi:lipoprotein-anchoring transpeptidase ErfK/SrfK